MLNFLHWRFKFDGICGVERKFWREVTQFRNLIIAVSARAFQRILLIPDFPSWYYSARRLTMRPDLLCFILSVMLETNFPRGLSSLLLSIIKARTQRSDVTQHSDTRDKGRDTRCRRICVIRLLLFIINITRIGAHNMLNCNFVTSLIIAGRLRRIFMYVCITQP